MVAGRGADEGGALERVRELLGRGGPTRPVEPVGGHARDHVRGAERLEAAEPHPVAFVLQREVGHAELRGQPVGVQQRGRGGDGAPGKQGQHVGGVALDLSACEAGVGGQARTAPRVGQDVHAGCSFVSSFFVA